MGRILYSLGNDSTVASVRPLLIMMDHSSMDNLRSSNSSADECTIQDESFPMDEMEVIGPECCRDFTCLPPEPELGNVEYKLKLVNPTHHRFEHLVTQMKWRLREGQGEAIYEIGVEDSGLLAGLTQEELMVSLNTLRDMAAQLGASITILRERHIDCGNGNWKKAAEVLVRKIPDDRNSIDLRVAVLGNVDAGKSTLIGVITQGELDNGRGRARLNMFRHLHEIQTGRTSSISHEVLGFNSEGDVINYRECSSAEEIVESSVKLITFLDLAGHQKYLHTTIFGLTGYSPHYSLLVVSANSGIAGTTREHLILSIALQVPIFVVVTKMDITPPSVIESTLQSLEALIKGHLCKRNPYRVRNEDDAITAGNPQRIHSTVPIFLVSNVSGKGLHLVMKYLYVLSPCLSTKERERLEQEPVQFQVDDTWDIPDVGTVVGGLLTKGILTENTQLLLGPLQDGEFHPVRVKSIHRNRAACRVVRASQSASLGLIPLTPALSRCESMCHVVRKGMVLLQPLDKAAACLYFQATIMVLYHRTRISEGFQATIHVGNVRQTAIIKGIMDRSLSTDQKSSVVFMFLKHPEYVEIGSRVLFREGCTKGIGKVTQVFPLKTLV
ncbi:unnamed protein product [Darwinula stevensoni]|uniref:Tr-type G domain-containing protein n=1 Tax=Darwinula stevensoni TaxID=69355 RepID=A0A7R8X6T0_9CRUS|nr:unnamed protein product [Darwinula stevensoni]CAG0888514.1 unnamed protein product [Darwinula stevensoni]